MEKTHRIRKKRTIFAPEMKKGLKRQLYAWLLLSVFVPMTVLSVLHVHESGIDTTAVCSACVNHQAHAGHLTTGIDDIHDCVLCQFLSLNFVAATAVLTATLTIFHRQRCVRRVALYVSTPHALHATRAPPFGE